MMKKPAGDWIAYIGFALFILGVILLITAWMMILPDREDKLAALGITLFVIGILGIIIASETDT